MIEFDPSPELSAKIIHSNDIESQRIVRSIKEKNRVLQEAVSDHGLTAHDLRQRLRVEFEYKRETRVYIDDKLVITYFSEYPLKYIEHYKN